MASDSGNRVAGESIKVSETLAKGSEIIRANCEARHRKAITHRLAHCDHVGFYAVSLETPKSVASAAKTRLHLVRDENATSTSNGSNSLSDEARRLGKDAIR
ncbi:hypothetical protein D9M70_533660 [compost metagenome]